MTHPVDYKYSLRRKGKEIKAAKTVSALTPKVALSSTSTLDKLPRPQPELVEAYISQQIKASDNSRRLILLPELAETSAVVFTMNYCEKSLWWKHFTDMFLSHFLQRMKTVLVLGGRVDWWSNRFVVKTQNSFNSSRLLLCK